MAKQTTTKQTIQLEKAPEPKPFLEGEYFRGLCEIAAACKENIKLFIPDNTLGIFQSLFYKRVYARKEMNDGSYMVGNFEMKNRFLYEYDRNTRTYGAVKEENYGTFIKTVKNIIETKDFKIFSLTPVHSENLDEVLA